MLRLGVNIDHVATVRQARRTVEPDPVRAAVFAESGGADGITVHLREDRRHIQDRDVRLLRETLVGILNLEMAVNDDVLAVACEVAPQHACLVPEKRQELTTEGGLRVDPEDRALRACIDRLQDRGTRVSLFIDPDPATVRHAKACGVRAVELHSGAWAEAWKTAHALGTEAARTALHERLAGLEHAAALAAELGLELHVGHGITYTNVRELLHLPLLRELNIGHSIVSRAVLVGMERAVREMKSLITAIH